MTTSKKWKTTSKKIKKMEDNLQKKWKTNQSTKIDLIGCDTIVNSPSLTDFIEKAHNLSICNSSLTMESFKKTTNVDL